MRRKYRVLISGFDPKSGTTSEGPRVGFYTARFLEASSPSEASELALASVQGDPRLAAVVKAEWLGHPVIQSDEVSEMALDEAFPDSAPGFIYFEDTDDPE